MDLKAFLDVLERGLPLMRAGELRAAWDACDDVDTMIAVLRKGGFMGVFEIDSVQEFSRSDRVIERWLFRLRSAGRYYRIDVRREDGAQGVRTCFPDFPDDWASLLDTQLDAMPPLEKLRSDLQNGRTPNLDEATQRAWSECEDPMTMLILLRALGHEREVARLADALPPMPSGGLTIPLGWKRDAARVVRETFPRLTRR